MIEVYIAMFVIRIIQLTIAFNHSYHTCKFDIYSTTKETHQSLFGAIMEIRIKK